MTADTRKAAAMAAVTALLIFATRLLVLYLIPEPIQPSELVTGALANALLENSEIPLSAYRTNEQGWGTFVLAMIAAPWFLCLGKTVISLKAAALSLAAVCAAMIVFLANKLEGPKAALLAGLLLAAAPPGAFLASAFARGPSLACLALALGALLAAFKAFRDDGFSCGWAFVWGLLSGAALSLDVDLLAPILVPIAVGLVRDAKFIVRREFGLALLGAAIGIIPLFLVQQPTTVISEMVHSSIVLDIGRESDVYWLIIAAPIIVGLMVLYQLAGKREPEQKIQGQITLVWVTVFGPVSYTHLTLPTN